MIQLQVLNYIIKTKDYSIISDNNLDSQYFSAYENEFNYIKNHFDKYNNVPDKASFLATFPNFDIIDITETKDYLLKELCKDRKSRYLTNSFNNIRNLIMEDKIDEAEAYLNKITTEAPKLNQLHTVNILEDTSRYDKYIEKCNDFSKFYIKTGFPELDKLIYGWDRHEDLVTIAARSGVGKSFMLFKFAVAAAEQGLRVGIYEGEMSEIKVGYRIDTLISHISNGQIMHGNSNIQNEYQQYLLNLKSKIKGTIDILTPNMLGGPAKVSNLKNFIETNKLDILCVDQHSLLDDDRGAKNPVEKASNISKDLKNLQVMSKIPILAVSQQNRTAVTEEGAGTEHIAQSDRISQDSTIILFLTQKDGILTMKLAKSRDSGSNKELKYKVDYDKGLYIYIPMEDDNDSNKDDKELEELKLSYEKNTPLNGESPF